MSEFDQLQQRIKVWADALMPERDIPRRIHKLHEESVEFGEAISRYLIDQTPGNAIEAAVEAADMVLVLADISDMMGLSLLRCIQLKMQIIEERPVSEFVEFNRK